MNTRKYTSQLREQQAGRTRERILDALVEVLAEGVESLSMPAVAEQAGVSVGTIYRHFGDKAGLLDALYSHAGKRTGIEVGSIPETLDEVDDVVRRVFQHFEDTDDLMRAAFASRIGREVRIGQTAERLEGMRQTVRATNPNISSDQLEHLARLMFILTTSDVYMQWKDRLGLDPEEVADEVMWALRAAIRGVDE